LPHAILSGNIGQGCTNRSPALERASKFCNRFYY